MIVQVRKIIFASAIAAVYAALTLVLLPISFNELQFRISEALTILPYFFPVAVPGLFVGCIIANILSPYGPADMIVGSAATLLAALTTMRLGKLKNNDKTSIKALACMPPVLINAVFIGALIAFYMTGIENSKVFLTAFAVNALSVGAGQMAVLYLLGLPLMIYLPKMGIIGRLRRIYEISSNQESKENND